MGYTVKAILFVLYLLALSQSPAQMHLIQGVPDVRQSTDYSCGAAALQSVLLYWGHEYMETDLMKMLRTTADSGTQPSDIVRVAQELKLNVELRQNMTYQDLERIIDKNIPVIICAQAWREGENLEKKWSDIWNAGHYMVIIGYDQNNIYLEDPWLLTQIAYIPRAEFLDRWHIYEGEAPLDDSDTKMFQMGILIKGKQPVIPPKLFRLE